MRFKGYRYKNRYKICYKQGLGVGMKYVQHVRGKWVVRITVPEELRDILGARELVAKDLPSNLRERERIASGIISGFLERIESARKIHATREKAPTIAFSALAKAHYANALKADAQMRSSLPTREDIAAERDRVLALLAHKTDTNTRDEISDINDAGTFQTMLIARPSYCDNRQRRLNALRSTFRTGETRWIEAAVEKCIAEYNLKIQRGSQEWKDLANALTRAEIEALERTLERDMGNFAGEPDDPLLTVPEPEKSEGGEDTITLTKALCEFHAERQKSNSPLAAKTVEEHRNAVRMFNEFMGRDMRVSEITTKHIVQYKGALLKTPNRYTMRFPGLTLPQAIKANEKLEEPFETLSAQTINMKWLSHLSSVLSWTVKNAHIQLNPAKGVQVDTGKKSQREPSRLAFTRSELDLIFGHEMFSDPSKYGLNQWALLVMLHTGVRNSSEMARMKLANIYKEQGVPVFDLKDATKTLTSKRLVPIHKHLIQLGFLDYAQHLRNQGETQLFPEWAEVTDKVNNWFNNTYLTSLGLKSERKVFYGFRHTLGTALARAGVPRELSKMISGHAPQEVASIYIQATPITLMKEALDRVDFELPIPALRKSNGKNGVAA